MSNVQPSDVPPDPLIDEVRAIRRAISEQFGNDVESLCDHLQELERRHPERVVEPTAPHESHTPPGQRA